MKQLFALILIMHIPMHGSDRFRNEFPTLNQAINTKDINAVTKELNRIGDLPTSVGPALRKAVSMKAYDILELLIMRGVAVDSIDIFDITALHEAVATAQPNCVQLLIRQRAFPYCNDARGRNAFSTSFYEEIPNTDPRPGEIYLLLASYEHK